MAAGGFVFDTGEGVLDRETGEAMSALPLKTTQPRAFGDCETGEQTQTRLVYQRSKFRVPRAALKVPVFETAVLGPAKEEKDSSFDRPLLLLPLLMLLPGWMIVLYCMIEVVFHNWSHSQRTGEMRKTPMRLLFKVTCAECVAKQQMLKVGKLQDKRTLRIHSRRILNYDYAQFGIVS